ncbi:uncharacterized protein [Dermacentor albipictus]|uniref:uncharacterized protein isoform X1 n=1 Tax=Dermacentor albipictus TaxID=60249 RepID=UPI0038FCB38B
MKQVIISGFHLLSIGKGLLLNRLLSQAALLQLLSSFHSQKCPRLLAMNVRPPLLFMMGPRHTVLLLLSNFHRQKCPRLLAMIVRPPLLFTMGLRHTVLLDTRHTDPQGRSLRMNIMRTRRRLSALIAGMRPHQDKFPVKRKSTTAEDHHLNMSTLCRQPGANS